MPLDAYYVERFAAVQGVTWDAVWKGDPKAVELAIAFGQPAGSYTPPVLDIRNATVIGPYGQIPVRIYAPHGHSTDSGCVVWMHGGAFKWGDLDMLEAHAVSAELAYRWRATVVSVDYRLAPGFCYPVQVEEVLAVLDWVVAYARDLRIDKRRLAIGGASAGANIALSAALEARDSGGPPIGALCLAYPAPHQEAPDPSPEIAALTESLPPLARFTPDERRAIYRDYLGPLADDPPSNAIPAASNLVGLPPCAIAVAEYDDLRPSGHAFSQLLREDGVRVEEWTELHTAHGYLNAVGVVAGAGKTIDRFVRFLDECLPNRSH
jgi:acetyl esterase